MDARDGAASERRNSGQRLGLRISLRKATVAVPNHDSGRGVARSTDAPSGVR
jgi:hypothetical protein